MSNRFLSSSAGGGGLDDGTAQIYVYSVTAVNLSGNQPMKTNANGTITTSQLDIADVDELQDTLDDLGDVWSKTGTKIIPKVANDSLGIDNLESEDGATDIVAHNTIDAQDNIKTDQISESTTSANITMNQKTIHSLGILDSTLTINRLVKTDGSGNLISATDINPHLTAGTNINFTGTDPLTINNSNLSALNVGDSPTFVNVSLSGKTTGSVLYVGASGALEQSNAQLFFDDTTKDLGIGTNVPGNKLDIVVPATTNSEVHLGQAINEGGYLTSKADNQMVISGGAESVSNNWTARSTEASLIAQNAGEIRFFCDTGLVDGNTYTVTERMKISPSGLFLDSIKPLTTNSDITIDVLDVGATSTLNVLNSDGSYDANLDVDGTVKTDTIQPHTANGNITIDVLDDSATSKLIVSNSDGSQVADLEVEGTVLTDSIENATSLTDVVINNDGVNEIVLKNQGNEKLAIGASGMQLGGAGSTVNIVRNEADMVSNDPNALATQQSIKSYVGGSVNNPGGANTNIQFNNSGVFGGSANLTWDGSSVGITGTILTSGDITCSAVLETDTISEKTNSANITMSDKTIHSGGIQDSTGTAFRLCHYDVNKNIVPVTALTSYVLDGTYIDVTNALNGDVYVNSTINQDTSTNQDVTFSSITSSTHTDNAVLFYNSSGTITGEADGFTWLSSPNFLGVGLGDPLVNMDIKTGSTSNSGFHLGEVDNEGMYMTSTSDDNGRISFGAEVVAGAWTARATSATVIDSSTGVLRFYADTGLTDGNTFTPTLNFQATTSNLIVSQGLRVGSETASTIVVFDTLKNVSSGALGSNLTLTTGTLDTVQGITTGSSPTFAKVITTEVENTGDITLDAINAAADSTVSILNSDGTYEANLDCEGDITTGGVLYTNTITKASGTDITISNTLNCGIIVSSNLTADRLLVTGATNQINSIRFGGLEAFVLGGTNITSTTNSVGGTVIATDSSPSFVGIDLSGTATLDTINEHTLDAGVTIEGCKFENGGMDLALGVGVAAIYDTDSLAEDSSIALATQQSIKAYVDNSPPSNFCRAYVSGTISDISGDGSQYVIIFDSKTFDTGSDFSTITGIYTVPADGYYSIDLGVTADLIVSTHTSFEVLILIGGSAINAGFDVPAYTGQHEHHASAMTFLTNGTSISARIECTGSAKTADILIGTSMAIYRIK